MRRIFVFAFIAVIVLCSTQVLCAEAGSDEGAASKFAIVILGTRNADDVKVIEKNIRTLSYVTLLVPTVVSQQHLEFEGAMTGSDETMIADVTGLSQDRYDVSAKRDSKRGLLITLRKMKE